jgi:hypothetical protein
MSKTESYRTSSRNNCHSTYYSDSYHRGIRVTSAGREVQPMICGMTRLVNSSGTERGQGGQRGLGEVPTGAPTNPPKSPNSPSISILQLKGICSPSAVNIHNTCGDIMELNLGILLLSWPICLIAGTVAILYLVISRIWVWYRLRHIKGPLWASFSKWWMMRKTMGGQMHLELAHVCDQYGVF